MAGKKAHIVGAHLLIYTAQFVDILLPPCVHNYLLLVVQFIQPGKRPRLAGKELLTCPTSTVLPFQVEKAVPSR